MRASTTPLRLLVVSLVLLVATVLAASSLQAQVPCTSLDPAVDQAIRNLEAQGAVLRCDNTHLHVNFPDGTYFSLTLLDNYALRLFMFNPTTGSVTLVYVDGGGTIWLRDDIYGMIDVSGGWYSVFYPLGNPFDASIQDPIQLLFNRFLPTWAQPIEGGRPRPPYQPILD